MGDFGYRPPRIRLLDAELTLDPAIVAMIRDVEIQMAARRDINLWLRPDWNQLPDLSRILLMPPPAVPASPFSAPRGAGPSTPRPGEISDVLSALWQVPAVQTQVNNVYGEARRQIGLLHRDWDSATTADRALMISMSGLVVGSSLSFLMISPASRQGIFNLLVNRDIPIPGVDGLSFRLLPRGAQVTTPTPVTGLSVTGGLNFGNSAFRIQDYNIMLNLDVTAFLRARRINF